MNRERHFISGLAGNEVATGNFSDYFIVPEATLGDRVALPNDATATPVVKLRHNATTTNAYSDMGSSQNLAYGAGTAQEFEERVDIKLNGPSATKSGWQQISI